MLGFNENSNPERNDQMFNATEKDDWVETFEMNVPSIPQGNALKRVFANVAIGTIKKWGPLAGPNLRSRTDRPRMGQHWPIVPRQLFYRSRR